MVRSFPDASAGESVLKRFRRRRLTALGLALILGSLAGGRTAQVSDGALTIEGLRELIDHRRPRSVDELVANLPEQYQSNFVLMKRSRSLQGASPLAPRVLAFGNTAQTIFVYNGRPEQAGYETVEMMEFRPEIQGFELRQIRFRNGRASISRANPRQCLHCHTGGDGRPRPLWFAYSQWPDAYGANNDVLSSTEREEIRRFLSNREQNPRYRNLKPLTNWGGYSVRGHGSLMERPNLRLTLLLARWNAKRLFGRFRKLPQFSVYRDLALLEAISGPTVREGFKGAYADLPESGLFVMRNYGSMLEALSAVGKLDLRDWNLGLPTNTIIPFESLKADIANTYFDGAYEMRDLVLNEFWKDLAREDQKAVKLGRQTSMVTHPQYTSALSKDSGATEFAERLDRLGGRLERSKEDREKMAAFLVRRLARHSCAAAFGGDK